MKKILAFSVIVLLLSAVLSAQKSEFKKGDKVFNFGIGFGSTLYSGIGNTSIIPPVSASYEFGVVDKIIDNGVIGIGGYAGFMKYKWNNTYGMANDGNFLLGGRGVYHYPHVDKLDTYTGLMLGYDVVSTSGSSGQYSGSESRPVASWFIGGRYYFDRNFAVMAELGYGVAVINFGISLKL